MNRKSICYETRKAHTGERKCTGTFEGDFSMGTVERLLKAHKFSVRACPSGSYAFIDRDGTEVSLRIWVNPRETSIGKAAMAECVAKQKRYAELEEAKQEQLSNILDGMSVDEAIAKLTGE